HFGGRRPGGSHRAPAAARRRGSARFAVAAAGRAHPLLSHRRRADRVGRGSDPPYRRPPPHARGSIGVTITQRLVHSPPPPPSPAVHQTNQRPFFTNF